MSAIGALRDEIEKIVQAVVYAVLSRVDKRLDALEARVKVLEDAAKPPAAAKTTQARTAAAKGTAGK